MSVRIDGTPSGPRPRDGGSWRERVAAAVREDPLAGDGLELDFTLRRGQFVDLDTLVQTAVAALRDAGAQQRGLPGLDAVLARKRDDDGSPGVDLRAAPAAALVSADPPGPALLEAEAAALPGQRCPGKAAWREILAAAWGQRPPLAAEEVWADVTLAVPGSILAPLEPVLDGLEPVLGRDPRGLPWQEFFPNDDRITWLRVTRAAPGPVPLRLRLGPRSADRPAAPPATSPRGGRGPR